jgi:hypothetical protein
LYVPEVLLPETFLLQKNDAYEAIPYFGNVKVANFFYSNRLCAKSYPYEQVIQTFVIDEVVIISAWIRNTGHDREDYNNAMFRVMLGTKENCHFLKIVAKEEYLSAPVTCDLKEMFSSELFVPYFVEAFRPHLTYYGNLEAVDEFNAEVLPSNCATHSDVYDWLQSQAVTNRVIDVVKALKFI